MWEKTNSLATVAGQVARHGENQQEIPKHNNLGVTSKANSDLAEKPAYRAQADASKIEAQAKRRIADEYDAAQARGEVATARDGDHRRSDRERPPTAADIGLSRKEIHEARIIRDAENADPGIVRRSRKVGRKTKVLSSSVNVQETSA
ncbi:hypothetical protein [Bradyrhizobium sp. URHC0002]